MRFWFLGMFVLYCAGCQPPQGAVSRPQELISRQGTCEVTPSAVETTRSEMPAGFVLGWSAGDDVRAVEEVVASVPITYRNFLFDLYRKGAFAGIESDIDLPAMGLTTFSDFSDGPPLLIRILAAEAARSRNLPNPIGFALRHEIGHAVERLVAGRYDGGRSRFAIDLGRAWVEGKASPKVEAYGKTHLAEFFAEAFDAFYCSSGAREDLARELPLTFDFLSRALEAPEDFGDGDGAVTRR